MGSPGDVDFGREALKGVSAKLLAYLFGFAATAFFARALGPTSLGGYFLLLSVVAFANRLPQGVGGACQKRFSEVDAPEEELLGVVLGTAAVVGAGAAVLAYLGREQLAAYTGLPSAALLAVPLFVTLSLYVPLMFLLCGAGRFGDKEWVEFGRDLAERPVQLVLVLAGLGAAGMAAGRVGATLLCLPLLLSLLAVRPAVPSRATVSSVWRFARPNVASNVVGKAYTRFDVFLLGFVGATAAVGFYEVALVLTGLGGLISGVVMDGLLSKVSALDSAGRGRRVDASVTNTLSYTSVVAVPISVLAVVLGGPIVGAVYGPAYLAAVPFVVGLAFYRVVQVQRETVDSALKGLDRPDLVFRSTLFAVVLNFAVGVPLLLRYGPTGVVVGTLAAELLRWGLLHRALAGEGHPVPRIPRALRVQVGSGLLAGGVLWAARGLLPQPLAPAGLFGLVLLGGAVYVAGVVAADPTARRALGTGLAGVRATVDRVVTPW